MKLSDVNRRCFRLIYDVLYIYLNMYFRCDLSRFSYAFVNNYFYSKLFFGPHGSHGRLFLRMKKIVWSNLWLCEHIAAFISHKKNGRVTSFDHCRESVMYTIPPNVIFDLFVCLGFTTQSSIVNPYRWSVSHFDLYSFLTIINSLKESLVCHPCKIIHTLKMVTSEDTKTKALSKRWHSHLFFNTSL